MRIRQWILVVTSSAVLVAGAAAGCGGTSTDTSAATDAGNVIDTSTSDQVSLVDGSHDGATGVDASADDDVCSSDADLNSIDAPDAPIGDASSVGLCLACAEANCGPQLSDCNADCGCKEAATALFQCVAGGTSAVVCGTQVFGGVTGNTQNLGYAIGFCVYSSCKEQCAPNLDASAFLDSGDTGTDAGSSDN